MHVDQEDPAGPQSMARKTEDGIDVPHATIPLGARLLPAIPAQDSPRTFSNMPVLTSSGGHSGAHNFRLPRVNASPVTSECVSRGQRRLAK